MYCFVTWESWSPVYIGTLTNPPAIPPAARRRSNVVKEVDRIQKKREERRKQQAEKKEEKEALMNLDPGNPQWEFLNMIREFRWEGDTTPVCDVQLTVHQHQQKGKKAKQMYKLYKGGKEEWGGWNQEP